MLLRRQHQCSHVSCHLAPQGSIKVTQSGARRTRQGERDPGRQAAPKIKPREETESQDKKELAGFLAPNRLLSRNSSIGIAANVPSLRGMKREEGSEGKRLV
jgi:hypothetical protein